MMKGKPAYMAPEQARGGGIDLRADLFAMGVVMFELLADRRPWNAKNDLETLIAVSSQEPPDLAEIRKVSPVFVEIVQKCLKKPPRDRFSSAAEVKELLDNWRRERGFVEDDPQSLAAFVARNTPQQQAWFQQALDGGLRLGGVTFSDLEARIDAGRKKVSGTHKEVPRSAVPAASVPAPAPPPMPERQPELEEIDENAQTRFMGTSPAAGLQRINGPAPKPMAGTVALTPAESARLGAAVPAMNRADAAQVGAQSALKPADLPLPPPRSGGTAAPGGVVVHGPSSSGFAPPASGPAASVPHPGTPISRSHPPLSGPISPHPFAGAPPGSSDRYGQPGAAPGFPPAAYGPPAMIAVTMADSDPKPARSPWRWLAPLLVLVLAGAGAAYWFVLRARYGI
jgi:serine/threonine-protein kinase